MLLIETPFTTFDAQISCHIKGPQIINEAFMPFT